MTCNVENLHIAPVINRDVFELLTL